MTSIGNWSVKKTPKEHCFKKPNYEEKFVLFYKECFCGFLYLCDFDKEWWAYIKNEKIRKKFYKDNLKFYKTKFILKSKGRISTNVCRCILASELASLCELESETQKISEDIYARVIVEGIFDRIYDKKISKKEIITDIKKEFPKINNFVSNRQIKNAIIEIFQIQDLHLNLHGNCCKTRKWC